MVRAAVRRVASSCSVPEMMTSAPTTSGTDGTEQSDDTGSAHDDFIIRTDGCTVAYTVLGDGEGLGKGGEFKIEPVWGWGAKILLPRRHIRPCLRPGVVPVRGGWTVGAIPSGSRDRCHRDGSAGRS